MGHPSFTRIKTWLGNLLLALVSSALCLGLLEGAARYELYNRKGGKEQRERLSYTVADPVLGWRKVPGARVVYSRRDFTTEVHINSHGLHDREREYTAAPGTLRVLALGDSFVEAYQVPLEDSVTQRLERALSATCRAEVINAGTAGYSTDQERAFYAVQGARYSPQIVTLFFYYNDVSGNVEVKHQPPARPPGPPQPAPPIVIEGSAAFRWVAERLEVARPHLYNRIAQLGLWPPTRVRTIAAEFLAYKRRPGPGSRPAWRAAAREIETAWAATEDILAALAADVRRDGARFLVVYIPNRIEVRRSDWELTVLRYGLSEDRWDVDRVRSELGRIGAAHDIPVLDLTDALRAEVGWFRWPYHEHDGHWNSLGHQIAARELERYLRDAGWLPGC